jgi:hypothetical protein
VIVVWCVKITLTLTLPRRGGEKGRLTACSTSITRRCLDSFTFIRVFQLPVKFGFRFAKKALVPSAKS